MSLKRFLQSIMTVFALITTFAVASTSFAASNDSYLYTSEKFGYSIKLPQKPIAVINLAILSPGEEGDVLIFDTDGHNPTKYWVVSPNAFSNDTFPDLDKISDQERNDLFAHLAATRGYETVTIVPINGQKAIYAVTAKTIQIDTNKDGKADQTIQQQGQNVETYLKGKKSNYCIVLSSNKDLTQDDINAYQYGLLSFKD